MPKRKTSLIVSADMLVAVLVFQIGQGSTQNLPSRLKQCKVGYMPVIDALPTELATVKEILKRSEEIADKLNLRHFFLVFDEAIFAKVQQIRCKKERYLSRFIVWLGDFHMTMAYCGAISKLFKDAVLTVHFRLNN